MGRPEAFCFSGTFIPVRTYALPVHSGSVDLTVRRQGNFPDLYGQDQPQLPVRENRVQKGRWRGRRRLIVFSHLHIC